MTAPSPKQLALQAVQQLPDASIEDAMERLYLLASIERGRADVAGRVSPTSRCADAESAERLSVPDSVASYANTHTSL